MVTPAPADQQLRALLKTLKNRCHVSYEKLATWASCSPQTAQNYVNKPGHGRDRGILDALLTALGADDAERAEAFRLHKLTCPELVDPAQAGWAAAVVAADCTVWEMEQFSPAEASVHIAIGRRSVLNEQNQFVALPSYVPRIHDTALRADITAAARGELPALIVLRGGASTGKTRSLFEAVHALCPNWAVVRPRSAAALRGLAESGLLGRRRCVVWLNEMQNFLGSNGTGLSMDVLRDLFNTASRGTAGLRSQPVVAVATLWPDKLRDATREDRFSDNRDLLTTANQWVRWHDVLPDLLASERASARALSGNDARLEIALTDPDRVGFTQTLAGGYELLQHYTAAPHLLNRLVLDAAGDARRLGHANALTPALLRAITVGLWREDRGNTSLPLGWFDTALAYATEHLRSTQGVQALIPLDHLGPHGTEGQHIGYDLADYLEQHLTRTRRTRPVIDATWAALRHHTGSPDDLVALANSASKRGHYLHAEALYRVAGSPDALPALAGWLKRRPGREADVEKVYLEAIAAGSPDALKGFAGWLVRQPGREDDAEQAYREAAAAGDPNLFKVLAEWLARQPGRERDAEHAYREAAAAGDASALRMLARWLARRSGREDDAERAYREAAAVGDQGALKALANWLKQQPEREHDAEQMFRQAAAAGDASALKALAGWLKRQPGRAHDAEQAYREAATAGDPDAWKALAGWLKQQPGRQHDAEAAYREAISAGDADALPILGGWLERLPGRQADVEQVYREAAAAGDLNAFRALANWLKRLPERQADVEQVYREAAAAGDPNALKALAGWFKLQRERQS
ncbi:helix-turn-helix domain-containing protein, partial [Amycolatopsis lurida]|uniref:helix-turn-helix domain-containing protein n=1 Tax=Amycolatopsis lurida TaxID=31959 RepID=UPI003653E226